MVGMTTDDDLAAARAAFAATATGYWEAIREADARRATAQTDLGQRIADDTAERGDVAALLRPLLADPSREVRYAAAAELVRRRVCVEEAVAVLTTLARDATGLVAVTAKMMLMQVPASTETGTDASREDRRS